MTDQQKIKSEGRACKRSAVWKSWSAFHRNRKGYRGYDAVCGECRCAKARAEDPAKHIARVKRWLLANPEKRTAKSNRYDAAHPEKLKARQAVRYAVLTGRLAKPEACQVCGQKTRLAGHHHRGYEHQLDVIWLCEPCHKAEHKRIESNVSA